MNVFLLDFYTKLRTWHELRVSLDKESDLQKICIAVDAFWQQCPMSNHYLHPADINTWPTPWQLLKDNNFCYYARASGMIYTLLLMGITDIDLVDAKDYNGNEVVLVLVDNAKYVLNYWPDTIINNSLKDFTITKRISIEPLIKKVGVT